MLVKGDTYEVSLILSAVNILADLEPGTVR